jgi:murein DD-endopeptidase MepM/ murein hydrolase activator NlpD
VIRRNVLMQRADVPVVVAVSIVLSAAAAAAAAPTVTSQGMIVRGGGPFTRTSPLGTARIDVRPGADRNGRLLASIVATDALGASASFDGIPGAAFFASDVGRVVAIEPSEANGAPGVVRVLDLETREVASFTRAGLTDPSLSSDGARLVYRTRDSVEVVDLVSLERSAYPRFGAFAGGPRGLVAGVVGRGAPPNADTAYGEAFGGNLQIFDGAEAVADLRLDERPVRLAFAEGGSSLLVLFPGALVRIRLDDAELETVFAAPRGSRLRDLDASGGAIFVGSRSIEAGRSTGWLATIAADGRVLGVERGPSRTTPAGLGRPRSSREIPWPIAPNLQHPVGNTYGEYQNYGTGGYLHPGVDVMGSPGQAVFAVRGGVVKAVLTTAADYHWRVAVADSATSGVSGGYLYAHIDHPSIAVGVGDTVAAGEYLGDLVEWPIYGFTHVHFARIEDEGQEWYGEWLATDNPHLDLDNQSDGVAPAFEPARGNDLLAFCANETSIYRNPDSLSGAVDIIAHVGDTIESTWVCTVQEIRYSIYPVGHPEFPVVHDRLALFCDMTLDTYFGGPIDPFLVDLLYKRDATCYTQGDYDYREFYHVITNSDGDQVYEESDRWEAWDTTVLPDADYVIRVSARDVAGNATADSMVVTTANGNTSWVAEEGPVGLTLGPCAPNPAGDETMIAFTLPTEARVSVSIYNAAGRLVRRLVDGPAEAGPHALAWDCRDSRGGRVGGGIYFVRLGTPTAIRTATITVVH